MPNKPATPYRAKTFGNIKAASIKTLENKFSLFSWFGMNNFTVQIVEHA